MKNVKIAVKSPQFLSDTDEDQFFGWLKTVKAVSKFGGEGRDLHIWVDRHRLSQSDLRELLGLFHRYRINKRVLAQFDSGKMAWMRNPDAYWYNGVFGLPTRRAKR